MRVLLLFCLFACTFAAAASDQQDAAATVQKLFDAMSAHNADAARALFMPGAMLMAVHANGDVSNSTSEQFAIHIGEATEPWVERTWDSKVLVDGPLAVVWANYDFHLNGKLTHCGVDSITLVKRSAEWKIAGITYTMRTSGCETSPLGPPAK